MKRNFLYNATTDGGGGKRFSTSEPYQERRAFLMTADSPVIDKEARTVELSFSSELPVERWFGTEILVHSDEAIDLSRLNNGHPLLLNHDPDKQVGVVVRAWLDTANKKARATVKFSKAADAEEVYQDVIDGIRGLVSVGYRVNSWLTEDTNGDGEPEVYRAVKWTPYEISIVSVPADPTVGVGRSAEQTTIAMNKNTLFDPGTSGAGGGGAAAPVIDLVAERNKMRAEEKKRVEEIRAIAKHNPNLISSDDVLEAIATEKSVDEVRIMALERAGKMVKVDGTSDIGMSTKEAQRFSVVAAIRGLVTNGRLPDFEREASEAFAKKNRAEIGSMRSFFIPSDVQNVRALSAGTYASGGALVPNVHQGEMIEILRNAVVVNQAGARLLTGLTGNVVFTRQNGSATGYWLSETGTVTESSQTFDQVTLTPKRLHATTTVYNQLLAQSSHDVEMIVRDDLMNVLAIAIDKAAIQGIGAAGEPLGVLNYAGVNATTAASIDWSVALQFRSKIAEDNALGANMAWLTSSPGETILMGRLKSSGIAGYLLEDGKMMGHPVLTTNSFATKRLVFGNFSQMLVGSWGGVEVQVDNITGLPTDSVKVFVKAVTDVAVRHIEAFCVDSSVIT